MATSNKNFFKRLFGRGEKKNSLLNDDFFADIEQKAKRRDLLFESQRPDQENYGYDINNPIMTSSVFDTDRYLDLLHTSEGERLLWERVGSHCMRELHGVENVMVDEYLAFLNDKVYGRIYICPYGHPSETAPKGFVYFSEAELLARQEMVRMENERILEMVKRKSYLDKENKL